MLTNIHISLYFLRVSLLKLRDENLTNLSLERWVLHRLIVAISQSANRPKLSVPPEGFPLKPQSAASCDTEVPALLTQRVLSPVAHLLRLPLRRGILFNMSHALNDITRKNMFYRRQLLCNFADFECFDLRVLLYAFTSTFTSQKVGCFTSSQPRRNTAKQWNSQNSR